MILRSCFVVVLALLFALPSAGQTLLRKDPTESEAKEMWQSKYRILRVEAAEAADRLETLETRMKRGRHRKTLRGTERALLEAEIDIARQNARVTASALAAFPEAARRADVPPGWLREVDDEAITPSANRTDADAITPSANRTEADAIGPSGNRTETEAIAPPARSGATDGVE